VQSYSQKLPGLGDVPVLGAMFSSVEFRKNETELVILVTPELVSALQPDQVNSVPGEHLRDPNDWELFGLGILEGKPAPEPAEPADALRTQTEPRYPKSSSPPDQMSLHGPWGPADQSEASH
jgi:Flp pilus assembly secretin CpaC